MLRDKYTFILFFFAYFTSTFSHFALDKITKVYTSIDKDRDSAIKTFCFMMANIDYPRALKINGFQR